MMIMENHCLIFKYFCGVYMYNIINLLHLGYEIIAQFMGTSEIDQNYIMTECKRSYIVMIVGSRGTKVAYRAKAHSFCTRKVYGWNFAY